MNTINMNLLYNNYPFISTDTQKCQPEKKLFIYDIHYYEKECRISIKPKPCITGASSQHEFDR